jgi:response regulator NasT
LIKPVNEKDLAAAIGVAFARFEEAQIALRENAKLKDNLESRKIIDRAKGVLMTRGLSEDAAYQLIQTQARDTQLSMRQVAEAILAEPQT